MHNSKTFKLSIQIDHGMTTHEIQLAQLKITNIND